VTDKTPPATTAPDLTEFFKYSKPKKPPCKIGVALGKLRGEQKKQLVAALGTDNAIITGSAIVQWLEKRVKEIDFNTSAVRSHRERKCSCADE
jgi:hypothetical protein